ncbi:hypothetical protein GLAREA_00967 [Glarea lozoyensis ATCC 20868]|uniref:2EXR domain-containing protein n=1 Tax=Glarea lozoyensis (strain ATCC 20868 / MF5171) TaxID=1116229 RepID=S3CTW0_GLAL2|nr:uncharacterized protein GLAREA_00967 [Glarea lozoyensis ATCC 20868]EPE29807.1 hypothetical protein GLAREA_00967 [Glarea lozoyensis ATCC 20868]
MDLEDIPSESVRTMNIASTNIATTTSVSQKLFNFSGLPNELQFAIIHLTYEPQTIVIENAFDPNTVARRKTPTPVALRLNDACRAEALKHYELLKYFGPPGIDFDRWPRIYINFKTDRIHLVQNPPIKLAELFLMPSSSHFHSSMDQMKERCGVGAIMSYGSSGNDYVTDQYVATIQL